MRIVKENENNKKLVENLSPGDVFCSSVGMGCEFYIVTDVSPERDDEVICINLKTGLQANWLGDTMVSALPEAKMVI